MSKNQKCGLLLFSKIAKQTKQKQDDRSAPLMDLLDVGRAAMCKSSLMGCASCHLLTPSPAPCELEEGVWVLAERRAAALVG